MYISVILPVYNSEKTIQFAIESVLAQSHSDFELLTILNGCTDGTEDIIRSFKDDRIKILYSEKSRVAARNLGIFNSSSEWIALQDSDDEWLVDKLKLQIEEINKGNCDIIGTQINCVDINRKLIDNCEPKRPTEHLEIVNTLLNGWNCIANASAIFRKSLINRIGIYEDCFPICEDYHLWLRAIKFARFKILDETLLNYMMKHNPHYDHAIPIAMSQFYKFIYGRTGI